MPSLKFQFGAMWPARWLLLMACWVGTVPLAADPPQRLRRHPQPSASRPVSTKRQRTLDLVRQLKSPVERADFEGIPLAEVLSWFKDRGLRNLMISWKAIERSGEIDRQTPITLSLERVTLGELLDLVLEQASDEALADSERLTYHIYNGLMKISTRADFDRKLFTRTYYVEDLLYPVTINELMPYLQIGQQFAYVAELDPVVAGGAAAQRPIIDVVDTGTFHGPGDPGYGVPDFQAEREQRLTALIDLLKSIEPRSWVEGGGRGTVSAFGDKLVVTQTIELHEIIGGTFETIQTLQRRPRPQP